MKPPSNGEAFYFCRMQLYGIRHHGPGSARSLLRALDAQQPDFILVEGPPDADGLLAFAAHAGMVPPVALLIYNPKNLHQASFFPFAAFSPEWQAIQFGLQHQVPVRFMDLPMSFHFGLKEAAPKIEIPFPLDDSEEGSIKPEVGSDPFTDIARLAGYTDPERWWEAHFERSGPSEQATIFQVVVELMTALREAKTRPESPETLLREAYMRQTIRAAHKEGFQNVAVVCGAWHTPALAVMGAVKPAQDAALLKGLKKIKTETTWIPWSFDRLSTHSGYGAGVLAPAWYRILWECSVQGQHTMPPQPATVWLTEAARLLREQDVETSSAHVVEAVRLANALAVLRQTALPGIEELRTAAVTVMGFGSEKPLELLDAQLVVGDVLGSVPAILPVPPLQADFEAQAKSCRLERSTVEKKLELDLREASDLRKSILLHRVELLGIHWGRSVEVSAGKQGRFHEHWSLKWLPDYEIRLIEAGAWGNTVESSALHHTLRRIAESENLPALTALLNVVLKAELSAALPGLLYKLQATTALSSDALLLADAVPPLVEALRYGQARRFDLQLVEQWMAQLIPRLCLQLPAACGGVNEEVAAEIHQKIRSLNRALGILQSQDFDVLWQQSLRRIHASDHAAPMLSGLCTRILFDKNWENSTDTRNTMRFRLSPAQPPAVSAAWLEGFLHGSGLLLLHHPALWSILDEWVRELSDDSLKELLPLLRRTFSRFPPPERGKMLELVKSGGHRETPFSEKNDADWEIERARPVMEMLQGLLSA